MECGELDITLFRDDGSAPEGYEESYININGLAKATDGSFWICEELNSVRFNLPEDFDEETGDRYQYAESVRQTLLRRVDAAGSELRRRTSRPWKRRSWRRCRPATCTAILTPI